MVIYGVITRLLGMAPSWSEELSRWLIVGLTFIAGSVAFKQGAHVGVTIMVQKMPVIIQKPLIQLTNILVIIFMSYVFWYGFEAAVYSYDTYGDIIQISMMYVKLNLPLGALIMIIHTLALMAGVIGSEKPEEYLISKIEIEE